MKSSLVLRGMLALVVTLMLISNAAAKELNESGTMTLIGRVTSQATMRTVDTSGTNLKYKAGDLVSQKNTVMLEYRWNLEEIMPGIKSSIFIQPRAYYDGAWDYGARSMREKSVRYDAGFVSERDVDEFKLKGEIFTGYIDFSGYDAFLRLGKQAFSWGEMSTVRILDGVNPLNTQGPGIAMEERLIPLGLIRGNYSKVGVGPFTSISLEGYYVPGQLEHTVNEGSPFGGPVSTVPDVVLPQISLLDFDREEFDEDRYGLKVGFTLSDLNLNFVYYRMASDSPASVATTKQNPLGNRLYPAYGPYSPLYFNSDFLAGTDIDIIYEPVDVFGGSFNYSLDSIDAVLRGEFAYKVDVPFTEMEGAKAVPYTSDVIAAGIGLDKNFDCDWLNPNSQLRVIFEQVYSQLTSLSPNGVYGWADPRDDGNVAGLPTTGLNPGYEGPTSWETRKRLSMNESSTQSILIVSSDFVNGKVKPSMTTIYEWETSAVMLIPSVTFTKNTDWDVKTQYTHTISDTYKSLGMTRDRNEFALTLNYYF